MNVSAKELIYNITAMFLASEYGITAEEAFERMEAKLQNPHKRRKTYLNDSDIERIIELNEQGNSFLSLAFLYDVSDSTLYNRFRKLKEG